MKNLLKIILLSFFIFITYYVIIPYKRITINKLFTKEFNKKEWAESIKSRDKMANYFIKNNTLINKDSIYILNNLGYYPEKELNSFYYDIGYEGILYHTEYFLKINFKNDKVVSNEIISFKED